MENLRLVRNIGISAHIDSGKTTLSERILYYAGKIHKIEEIRGGGDGATMDHMDLERERGITITSAATTVSWDGHKINLIDTPGHVDFTVEVERSLRVLDGAVLVLCAVAGVQSQSITVDRQMKRYGVPRIAFINKMDRTGANEENVIEQLDKKLGLTPVPLQIPMGREMSMLGLVDLVAMKAVYYDGEKGEKVRTDEIPADYLDRAKAARHHMLESLSMYSDQLMEMLLEETQPPLELVEKTIRDATVAQQICPVMMGTAYKNKGVQSLLDAVVKFLPTPLDREPTATDNDSAEVVKLLPDATKPLVAMAFKLVEEAFGQVTYMRIYQGTLDKGSFYTNTRQRKRGRISRILRVHADEKEDINSAEAGDIVAVMGIECATGDTYCAEDINYSLESIFAAEPVIDLSIAPAKRADYDKLSKALNRFMREDPTFRVHVDQETSETIISGMGELHLEIYVERIKREYKVECQVGMPKVSYRESPTKETPYNYTHKKQTGGSGQYGKVVGRLVPIPAEEATEPFVFENKVTGGRIPNEYIPSIEKGFRRGIVKGPLAGYEVINVKMVLEDGAYHDVDSSTMAFEICAFDCFREYFRKAEPVLLEPIMKVEVETPTEFQGPVTGQVSSKRGVIINTENREGFTVINAEVPLSEMFGYSNDLRSMTQGKGGFSMEFLKYQKVPARLQDDIIKKAQEEAKAKG